MDYCLTFVILRQLLAAVAPFERPVRDKWRSAAAPDPPSPSLGGEAIVPLAADDAVDPCTADSGRIENRKPSSIVLEAAATRYPPDRHQLFRRIEVGCTWDG